MTCINTSHEEFKSLLKETGKSSLELELDVAAWQQTQNSDLFPTAQELYPDEISLDYYTDEDFKKMSEEYDNFLVEEYEYLSKPNEISYKLKAVEILNTTKAKKTFEKGEKNSWSLNKILTELQIPKEQRELILEFGLDKRTDILERLKTFQISVEINITKAKNTVIVENNNRYFEYVDEEPNRELTKEEYEREKNKTNPSQYYSYLTVPGGANYTEQEIATPQIVPSIKGHAQFATNNGIGWFRSDEATYRLNQPYFDKEKLLNKIEQALISPMETTEGYLFTVGTETPSIKSDNLQDFKNKLLELKQEILNINENTKTRRILEVQSDLFQKGRDKEDLTGIIEYQPIKDNTLIEKIKSLESPFGDIYIKYNGINYSFENGTWNEPITINTEVIKNQFLQLLNKNSNWVTFFIKGIVQDSEKRGYEKVLFPSGDTASKVEGHSTVEDFKKVKEDRIKELERNVKNGKELIADYDNYKLSNTLTKVDTKNEFLLIEYVKQDGKWYQSVEKDINLNREYSEEDILAIVKSKVFDETSIEDTRYEIGNFIIEINQLEQELESVERDGLAALKPIWNFYENVVSKITKKLYNSETVTDEYGNTWQEITLVENNVVPLPEDLNDFINFDKICLL